MVDRIENLAHVLRRWHNVHSLDSFIKRLMVQADLIGKTSEVHSDCIKRNTPDCTFAARVIAKDNKLGEDIDIIVKPEHSEKRSLRVIIQVGGRMFSNLEDIDNPKWSDKKTFHKEVHEAEKYIEAIVRKLAA